MKYIKIRRFFIKIDTWWYDFKWGVKNLFTHFKLVWYSRPWSFDQNVLEFMLFKLKQVRKSIATKDYKMTPDKLIDIDESIKLIQNIITDDYIDRYGGLTPTQFPFSDIDERTEEQKRYDEAVILSSKELADAEWARLWHIISKGSRYDGDARSWWD